MDRRQSGQTNHSEYRDLRGIPSESFLHLDRNIAINVGLFLFGNGAGTHGEVKINTTASVHCPIGLTIIDASFKTTCT